MAAGDLLSTAISGLLVSQRGLATAGHNVANVNTEGFSRQRVEQVTRPPTPYGDGFLGNGATINTVTRVYDQFVSGRFTDATTTSGQTGEFYRLATRVDNLLADPQAGLAPLLQRFFNSVNDVANDPQSTTARQVMLSEANSLVDRFDYLNQRFSDLRDGVNSEITNRVSEINTLASSIAQVNRDIVLAQGLAGGQPANDLLDKRDALVNDLASKVSVRTVLQDDGALNVFIGNGQTLVIGPTYNALSVVRNPYDVSQAEVGYTAGGVTTIVTSMLTGGSLGGALEFRGQMLDAAQNALGRIATGLADGINAQHRLGLDLNGAAGGDFFSPVDNTAPVVTARSGSSPNTGTLQFDVDLSVVSALTTSDYQLDYDGANYQLTRLSTNTLVGTFAGFPQTIEGMTLTLTAGAANAGDSFLIQPTRNAARDISVLVSDPSRIAAAGPLLAAGATNANGLPTNGGTATITPGTVSNTTNLPLAGNITLSFDPNAGGAGVPGFTVAGGPAGPLLYDPATEYNGKQFSFAPGYGGFTFTVSGVPQANDQFVIRNNTGAVSDNRNALALAGLRDTLTLVNGTASLEDAYGQMVGDVGSRTHQADVNRQAQQALLNTTRAERDSVSGVNLDEEAANMVRLQQAYQAAAQMIAVSDTLFQSLIAAVRR